MPELDLGRVVGPGVAPGGAAGSILSKLSVDDYDTGWKSMSQLGAELIQPDNPVGAALSQKTERSGFVPYGKELTESWSNLRARIIAGDFAGIHIGDYKPITLTTGEVVIMEASGIDQYYKCGDAQIGHHIDFISRDCLAGTKKFNDTSTNNGTQAEPNPWRASKLFQILNDETTGVYAILPADLKPCIIEKRAQLEIRFSAAGALNSSAGWAWNSMGKLWLPTEVEVFGNSFWSDADSGWTGGGGCNLQYPIFYGGAKHIIKGAGSGGARCAWWEAVATRQSATHVCCAYVGGTAIGYVANGAGAYAPLCFRIG